MNRCSKFIKIILTNYSNIYWEKNTVTITIRLQIFLDNIQTNRWHYITVWGKTLYFALVPQLLQESKECDYSFLSMYFHKVFKIMFTNCLKIDSKIFSRIFHKLFEICEQILHKTVKKLFTQKDYEFLFECCSLFNPLTGHASFPFSTARYFSGSKYVKNMNWKI